MWIKLFYKDTNKLQMLEIYIKISYAGVDDDVVIMSVRGYIDTTTSPELSKRLEEQIASGKYKIIINLEGIDYISSTGWGVFIANLKKIRSNKGDLILVNMVPGVRNIFELMEFSSILKDFDSLDKAKAYFLGSEEEEKIRASGPQAKETKRYEQKEIKTPFPETAKQASAVASSKDQGLDETTIFITARNELGRRILCVISDQPYYDIKEIAKALRLPQYGWKRAGKRSIKNELKSMGLLDNQERYEFVMKKRKQ